MRRVLTLAATAILAIATTAACAPRPAPPPEPATRWPARCPGYESDPDYPRVADAIFRAWRDFGSQRIVDKAGRVACCESGMGALAGWPDGYYKGVFQLAPHIVAIYTYGGNWWDPWQNAQAARDLWVTRGRSFSAQGACAGA